MICLQFWGICGLCMRYIKFAVTMEQSSEEAVAADCAHGKGFPVGGNRAMVGDKVRI